jgi:hypothetical protein
MTVGPLRDVIGGINVYVAWSLHTALHYRSIGGSVLHIHSALRTTTLVILIEPFLPRKGTGCSPIMQILWNPGSKCSLFLLMCHADPSSAQQRL